MGQIGSHVEYKHDPFIKWVNHVDPNMIRTWLASTYGLFINGLVVLGSWVASNFATLSRSSCSFKNLALHAQSSPNIRSLLFLQFRGLSLFKLVYFYTK